MLISPQIGPLWTAIFAAGLCITGCSGTDKAKGTDDMRERADKHYEVALGSFHNGMYSDAEMNLSKALSANEEHSESRYLEGLIALRAGKTLIDAISTDLCLRDDAALIQRSRADDLHRKAHSSFDIAARNFGEQELGKGRALNSMAVVSLYFGDHKKAIEEAKSALGAEFYKERYSALSNLGWAYYKAGDLVQAMTELRQAVLRNPDYCVGRYRLAQVYLDYDMNEQALEEIQQVASNNRCPIQDAHRVFGVAQLRTGQVANALQSFESCIQIAPRSCLAQECEDYASLAIEAAKRGK